MPTDDTENDDDVDESSECTDPRLARYSEFVIDTPLEHPFNALKSHNIQFGLALGITLAMFTTTDVTIALVIPGVTLEFDAFGLSVIGLFVVLLYALGFERIGPVDTVSSRESAIGAAQIRHKPHYVTTPMIAAYVATLLVLSGV